MKILICGSRKWVDPLPIKALIWGFHLKPDFSIVHGLCRTGADAIAYKVAEANDIEQYPYPADWKAHGKGAGPIRNQLMLDEHQDIDAVFAFKNNFDHTLSSGGTEDMVKRAKKAGIPVYLTERL